MILRVIPSNWIDCARFTMLILGYYTHTHTQNVLLVFGTLGKRVNMFLVCFFINHASSNRVTCFGPTHGSLKKRDKRIYALACHFSEEGQSFLQTADNF